MDGLSERLLPALDTSSLAGRITAIVAARHEVAMACGDSARAARFDTSLDTIYFAALLLSVNGQNGDIRTGAQMLEVLDATTEIIAELRDWIAGATP